MESGIGRLKLASEYFTITLMVLLFLNSFNEQNNTRITMQTVRSLQIFCKLSRCHLPVRSQKAALNTQCCVSVSLFLGCTMIKIKTVSVSPDSTF